MSHDSSRPAGKPPAYFTALDSLEINRWLRRQMDYYQAEISDIVVRSGLEENLRSVLKEGRTVGCDQDFIMSTLEELGYDPEDIAWGYRISEARQDINQYHNRKPKPKISITEYLSRKGYDKETIHEALNPSNYRAAIADLMDRRQHAIGILSQLGAHELPQSLADRLNGYAATLNNPSRQHVPFHEIGPVADFDGVIDDDNVWVLSPVSRAALLHELELEEGDKVLVYGGDAGDLYYDIANAISRKARKGLDIGERYTIVMDGDPSDAKFGTIDLIGNQELAMSNIGSLDPFLLKKRYILDKRSGKKHADIDDTETGAVAGIYKPLVNQLPADQGLLPWMDSNNTLQGTYHAILCQSLPTEEEWRALRDFLGENRGVLYSLKDRKIFSMGGFS